MAKKVLIVCYSFPPFPGIGGRRWAKFAKYFVNNDVECHIINAFNYGETQSLWNKDAENPHIIIHPVKFRFQYLMGLNSKKAGYRILAKLLRVFINFTKYSPYFSTSISQKLLKNKCTELINQHKIDTIIVSGDPYMNLYVTRLKKNCHINVILDYRDLWNDFSQYNQNRYHSLTKKQRTFFELAEKESLKNCDDVVCVYEPMINLLSVRSGKSKKKFHLIPNGFDKDDYPEINKKLPENKTVTLYYGGSISGERANYFILFLRYYSQLRISSKSLWEKFRIEINGDSSSEFDNNVKELSDPNILFEKKIVSGSRYIEKLNESDFGILPVHDDYADNCFSTKVFDYFYLKKPIIHLGKKGKVSEFIENNGIGFSFNPDEKAEVFFEKIANIHQEVHYPGEVYSSIERDYDINNLSREYLELVNETEQKNDKKQL